MDSISEIEEVAGGRRRGFSKYMLRTAAAVLRTVRGLRHSASLGESAKAMTRASDEPTSVQISDGTLDERTERMMLINRALRNPTFSRFDTLGG
jgi:hypothetical protein